MDEVSDCSGDGTCAENGSLGLLKKPIDGVKFADTTLLEESYSALQQFAIGRPFNDVLTTFPCQSCLSSMEP